MGNCDSSEMGRGVGEGTKLKRGPSLFEGHAAAGFSAPKPSPLGLLFAQL